MWMALCNQSALGDPKNISNAIKQGKNSLKWTEFHVDFINGLHSEVRGRAPGRKAVFHISLPINRYNFFKALISNFISTFYDFYFMFLYPFFCNNTTKFKKLWNDLEHQFFSYLLVRNTFFFFWKIWIRANSICQVVGDRRRMANQQKHSHFNFDFVKKTSNKVKWKRDLFYQK